MLIPNLLFIFFKFFNSKSFAQFCCKIFCFSNQLEFERGGIDIHQSWFWHCFSIFSIHVFEGNHKTCCSQHWPKVLIGVYFQLLTTFLAFFFPVFFPCKPFDKFGPQYLFLQFNAGIHWFMLITIFIFIYLFFFVSI